MFAGEHSVRVMTFNIKDGGQGREHLIFEVFTTVQPDLILLQEVTSPNLVQDWAARMNMEFVVAKGHSIRHVAILSRFPIRSCSSNTSIPRISRDFLAATIEYEPLHALGVFVVHLAAQPF